MENINTQLESFEDIQLNIGERQMQVLVALDKLGFATNSMIANFLKLPINCVTGRNTELRDVHHLVEKSHVSWCPITRNRAIYWKLVNKLVKVENDV